MPGVWLSAFWQIYGNGRDRLERAVRGKTGSQHISNSLQESDRSDDMHGAHIIKDGLWETFPCKGAFWTLLAARLAATNDSI